MATPLPHVCLPINLDAFVLNEKVCDEGDIRIAPITVPDYAGLRLNTAQVQHDILPRIDLVGTQPASSNARISTMYEQPFVDVIDHTRTPPDQAGSINRARLGVYIHWSVPRAYRSASAAASPAPAANQSTADSSSKKWQPKQVEENQNPVFPVVPNRWLVVRILKSYELYNDAPKDVLPPPVAAWMIESDRLRTMDELDALNNPNPPIAHPNSDGSQLPIDLESEVTPFVMFNDADAVNEKDLPNLLSSQADKYLGYKIPVGRWVEQNLPYPQRVRLTTMNSSNPLFADYTLHNPNVFSTNDNLFYGYNKSNQPLYLQAATCDYIVVGWHSSASDDPLGVLPAASGDVDLKTRLSQLFCATPPPTDSDPAKDLSTMSNSGATRLVCHGAKYTVVYDENRPNTPADAIAARFQPMVSGGKNDFDMEPVAAGTTPLDAVMAFFEAHQDKNGQADAVAQLLTGSESAAGPVSATASTPASAPSTNRTIGQTLMSLRELLYSSEDDYDGIVKAADLIYSHNYGRSPGGFTWRYDKTKTTENAPVAPSPAEQVQLRCLNDYQHAYDAAALKLTQLRWALFAEFFKYISDPTSLASSKSPDAALAQQRISIYSTRVHAELKEAGLLMQQMQALQTNGIDRVVGELGATNIKKVARDPFFRRKDPSLCIAGLDAGWDAAFLSNTPTRFATKIVVPNAPSQDIQQLVDALRNLKSGADNQTLNATVATLVGEAAAGVPTTIDPTTKARVPLVGFKTWEGQPFSPQFIEWEASYYHVPWEDWDVTEAYSALASSNHPQVGYHTTTDLSQLNTNLKLGWLDPAADVRHITGRVLVLPQPSFSFAAVVGQVIGAATPSQLPAELQTPDQRTAFIAEIGKMPFISGELSGITEGLLTMANGQHVKPLVRPNGGAPVVMGVAAARGKEIGFESAGQTAADAMAIIEGETALTPYGTMVDFPEGSRPFKGVQHGQLAITSLHLVDKFGQVIPLPTPHRDTVASPTSTSVVSNFVHPCLSEQLIPSLKVNASDAKILNTVFDPSVTVDHAAASGTPMTPFMQLTPSINQEARINMEFLLPGTAVDGSLWLPSSEWDNPIFGWVIVNYADSSLQFFTGEGVFYTSLQFGGPDGTIKTPTWRPFDPEAGKSVPKQLDSLIEQVRSVSYLEALSDLIVRATPSMPFPPSQYAAYANAIIGKPLALVNVGLSLELSQPPWWAQNTIPAPPGNPDWESGVQDPLRVEAQNIMSQYGFKVKLGDSDRPFDGLAAYWDWNFDKEKRVWANDWTKLWTYFPGDESNASNPRKFIYPGSLPPLTPRFIDPSPALRAYSYATDVQDADQYTSAAMDLSSMLVKTMLIDPYTPVHAYSGILPIKSLQLPSWTIQSAMRNMTAFFTAGPILVTTDVPKTYNSAAPLHADSWLNTKPGVAGGVNTTASINLPIAAGKGDWNWLQPYFLNPVGDGPVPGEFVNIPSTLYNSLAVGPDDGRLRHDPAPYTFIEGYLQLARPLDTPQLPIVAGSTTAMTGNP